VRLPTFIEAANASIRQCAKLVQADALLKRRAGKDDPQAWKPIDRFIETLGQEPLVVSQLVRDRLLAEVGGGDPSLVRAGARPAVLMDITAALKVGIEMFGPGGFASHELQMMADTFFTTTFEMIDLLEQPWWQSRDRLTAMMDRINMGGPEMEGPRQILINPVKFGETMAQAEAACGAAADPFTGKPLLRKGDVLYSVGPDGVDNGGDPALDVVVPRVR